jgi:hypothetical protein
MLHVLTTPNTTFEGYETGRMQPRVQGSVVSQRFPSSLPFGFAAPYRNHAIFYCNKKAEKRPFYRFCTRTNTSLRQHGYLCLMVLEPFEAVLAQKLMDVSRRIDCGELKDQSTAKAVRFAASGSDSEDGSPKVFICIRAVCIVLGSGFCMLTGLACVCRHRQLGTLSSGVVMLQTKVRGVAWRMQR